jgi:hypothetical protein
MTRHLSTVLLTFFGVYLYRDIYPLITFDRVPADEAEGAILLAKFGTLFVSAIAIPLAMPRRYVPADPAVSGFSWLWKWGFSDDIFQDPMPAPNPEQTASLFSVLTFTFLDPIVKLANKIPILTADLLPPLSDYDRSKVLKARAFPVRTRLSRSSSHSLRLTLKLIISSTLTRLPLTINDTSSLV